MHAKNLFICRRMKQQAKEMHNNVGFLDPQVFSATMLQFQTKEVTKEITKSMKHDIVVVVDAKLINTQVLERAGSQRSEPDKTLWRPVRPVAPTGQTGRA